MIAVRRPPTGRQAQNFKSLNYEEIAPIAVSDQYPRVALSVRQLTNRLPAVIVVSPFQGGN